MLKELSDVHFPDAEQIRLVQDNLSTHTPASLYATFPTPEARRLAKRFEWRYTPKDGSRLDMAESELGVLSSQCLSRRVRREAGACPPDPTAAPRKERDRKQLMQSPWVLKS